MPWKRAQFKGKKIWVEVDTDGRPQINKGLMSVRYSDAANVGLERQLQLMNRAVSQATEFKHVDVTVCRNFSTVCAAKLADGSVEWLKKRQQRQRTEEARRKGAQVLCSRSRRRRSLPPRTAPAA